jgi:hypothetical protein
MMTWLLTANKKQFQDFLTESYKALYCIDIERFTPHEDKMDNTTQTNSTETREVFSPTDHDNGTYENVHRLQNVGMKIQRQNTRKGRGKSFVSVWRYSNKNGTRRKTFNINLTLQEARSLRAFLDRELDTLARNPRTE